MPGTPARVCQSRLGCQCAQYHVRSGLRAGSDSDIPGAQGQRWRCGPVSRGHSSCVRPADGTCVAALAGSVPQPPGRNATDKPATSKIQPQLDDVQARYRKVVQVMVRIQVTPLAGSTRATGPSSLRLKVRAGLSRLPGQVATANGMLLVLSDWQALP